MSLCEHFSRIGYQFCKCLLQVCVGPRAIVALNLLVPLFSVQAQTVGICDRTSQVQDAILPQLPGMTCETVTPIQLSGITEIDLTSKNISSLKGSDFSGLNKLDVLYLHHNSLKNLPEDLFAETPSLRVLFLGANSLTELPLGLFSGLSKLTELNLSYNSLVSLPEDLFHGLKRLRLLSLNSNHLTTLPLGLFDGLSNLQFLWLYNNSLVSLPDNLFNELTSLHLLGLSDNNLTRLDEGQFDELTRLKTLNIGNNRLENLHPNLFDGLTNLETLWIVDTPLLTDLPANLFDGLNKLKTLNLENNALANLPPSVFDDLTNLKRLRLGKNELIDLPLDLFDDLTNLERLDMDENQLTSLPEDLFNGLTKLVRLDLDLNQLTSLPSDLFDGLIRLEFLNLQSNELALLSEHLFNNLTNLKQLYLNNNQLASLPENLFDFKRTLPPLLSVYLTRNQIKYISPAICVADRENEYLTLYFDRDIELCPPYPVATLHLTAHPNPVTEGERVQIRAVLSEALPNTVTIPLILTSVTSEEGDHDSISPVNIGFAGGQTEAEHTIQTYEDDDIENESFTAAVDEDNLPPGIILGSPASVNITIRDVTLPEVSLSVDHNSVAEGQPVMVTIELSKTLTNNVTVPLILTPGTAESDDYDSTSPVNVEIPNGQTEAEYTINTYEDDDIENETLTVTIDEENLPSGIILGSSASAEITITDPDTLTEVSLSVDSNSVEEGQPVVVTIELSETLANNATIPLILTPGTAESDDYDSASPVNVEISNGQTEAEYTINTYEDEDAEDETFAVAIDEDNLPAVFFLGGGDSLPFMQVKNGKK